MIVLTNRMFTYQLLGLLTIPTGIREARAEGAFSTTTTLTGSEDIIAFRSRLNGMFEKCGNEGTEPTWIHVLQMVKKSRCKIIL